MNKDFLAPSKFHYSSKKTKELAYCTLEITGCQWNMVEWNMVESNQWIGS